MHLIRFVAPLFAVGVLCGTSAASPFVTNFEILEGSTRARGMWRNEATGTNIGIPVTLKQRGGEILGTGAPDPTVIDNTFSWSDAPPSAPNLFEPNFTGDLINVGIPGGEICDVIVAFNGLVENPVISVRGIGVETVLFVSDPFTVVAQAPNMVSNGSIVTSDGTPVDFLGEETSGSLRVDGKFTGLMMTMANFGSDPVADQDEVGFVFSAAAAPEPTAVLSIAIVGTDLVLSWPDTVTFASIEVSPNLHVEDWQPLAGADPTTSTTYVVPLATLGENRYFRGVYAN